MKTLTNVTSYWWPLFVLAAAFLSGLALVAGSAPPASQASASVGGQSPTGPTFTPIPTATPCTGGIVTATCTVVPGTSDTGNHCNDCVTNITLPFPYSFFGQSYTQGNVSSNGNVQFVSGSPDAANVCLPAKPMGPALLVHWDDLRTDMPGDGIFTSVSGSPPDRIFNIEWRTHYVNDNGVANFEVRLYEGMTMAVTYVYGQVDQGGSSATVGAQRGVASVFWQYECNTGGISPGLCISAWVCSTPTATPTATCVPPTTRMVLMTDYYFSPQTVTVTQGSTVNWMNEGPSVHTTTSDTGVWDSGNRNPGYSFQFTFWSPGTYPYHCTLHPQMTGTVIVTDCGLPTPTLTPTRTATSTSTFTVTPTFTPTRTPTPACPPTTRGVLIINFQFSPQTITITQGSTISWFNEGPAAHTSTSDTGVWDSGNINPGQSFQFKFWSPGTYPYHCTIHPQMTGTIIVTDCGLPTPTPTPSCPLQWRLSSNPNVGTYDNHLLAVTSVSANDIWATGYYYDGFASRTLTEHWDGTSWSVVNSPNVGFSANSLAAVAAVSTNDVWAVGSSGVATLIERWNGTSWNVVSSPSPGVSFNSLAGIEVIAANDIWAVGSYYTGSVYRTLVEHWNGGGWSVVSSPNVGTDSNFLWGGVSSTSANDVWAVGSYGPSGSGRTLVLHWNGTSWSVVSSPNVGNSENRLIGVSAVSANDVWAAGFYGPYLSEQTLVQHWDGSVWSLVPSPNPPYRDQLLDVVALASNDVWAVGFSGSGSTLVTLTAHWDGSAWSAVSSPNQPGSYNYLEAVSAVSDSYIWAVGSYQMSNVYHTLSLRYSYVGTGCPTATVTRTPTATATRTPTPVCPPTTRQALMADFQFIPQTITITQGSSVNWLNEGPSQHTTTSDTGVWDSGTRNPGQTFQFAFNTPGTYPYHCSIHPGMTGTIVVPGCGTPTPTATPTVVPILVGHVNWQARPPQPDPLQVLPITLTLKMGAAEVNYQTQLTDQYGFFTVTVAGLPNGTYNWRADDSTSALHSPNYLANSGQVGLTGALQTDMEIGLMRTGDASNDNIVNLFDFNMLKVSFGFGCGQPGYDNRADFTGDCAVNVADFNPLKANFGQGGAPPIVPR